MSSGPVGLDSREYAYGVYKYEAPDAFSHSVSANKNWLVTRIQFYAAAGTAAEIHLGSKVSLLMQVAAGGCLELEPNGAHRGDIFVSGEGSLLLVEYWFQANPTGSIAIVIDG